MDRLKATLGGQLIGPSDGVCGRGVSPRRWAGGRPVSNEGRIQGGLRERQGGAFMNALLRVDIPDSCELRNCGKRKAVTQSGEGTWCLMLRDTYRD